MKILPAAIFATTLFATAVNAAPNDPRINIDGASCDEARQIVERNGAAILTYSSRQSGQQLFDRFVTHSGMCMAGEVAWPETIFRREGACRLMTCQTRDVDDRGVFR